MPLRSLLSILAIVLALGAAPAAATADEASSAEFVVNRDNVLVGDFGGYAHEGGSMTVLRKRPSAALVVAMIALFVALGGTAGAVVMAAVPLAKRALVADNAKKLAGQTPSQLVAQAAAAPGPASTAAGLIAVKPAPFALSAGGQGAFTATCDAGQKAIGGGYANPVGTAVSVDTGPTSDGSGWSIYLIEATGSASAVGIVQAICLK